jgi:RNA polymerase sigma-70 factor (ECF subfamily)
MLPDEEIVARILNGEKLLYESLIRKYNQRLYRIGRSIVNDDDEVEDIMQTAYLNAYVNLAGFKNNSSFSTWLTKILINESLLYKKRKAKLEKILVEKQEIQHHTETPLAGLMNTELKILLEKSIARLPEKYRLVFVMREVEEMSTNETMETLNLSESNVKVRLNRAKEMLRDSLSSQYRYSGVYDFHLTRCDRVTNHVMVQIEQMSNYQLAN